jgi:hypothetical protein
MLPLSIVIMIGSLFATKFIVQKLEAKKATVAVDESDAE